MRVRIPLLPPLLETFHMRSVCPSFQDFKVATVSFGKSRIHGRGLFTTERRQRGDLIGKYEGARVVRKVADQREAE